MPVAKPYTRIPIRECGEPLATIPRDVFALTEPHPYATLGAPYGDASPWMLRLSVIEALKAAQNALQSRKPGWKILLFDAYRPNAVQAFMVEHEMASLARAEGLDPAKLSEAEREKFLAMALRIFAVPSDDPATPPPHSTGAVVDCTLIDEAGHEVDMGSPIDENSGRSLPDHFAAAIDEAGRRAHANRSLLNEIMESAGFRRNPSEWWHFSQGDQLATWIDRERNPNGVARFGRACK
ncbi:MAG: D-alanyl-D-alanine dipeptidase [Alphaproteobacteria bacterium]|nr:D-alanyl-D-alanine dipeptidase [Alphaproteobacteria bacterium]